MPTQLTDTMKRAAVAVAVLLALAVPAHAATVTPGSDSTTSGETPQTDGTDGKLQYQQGRATSYEFPAGTTAVVTPGDQLSIASADLCAVNQYSMQIVGTGSGGNYFGPWVTTVSGHSYDIKASVKWPATGHWPYLATQFGSGGGIYWFGGGASASPAYSIVNTLPTAWQHLTATVTATDVQMRFVSELYIGEGFGGVDGCLFDNLQVWDGTTLLQNLNFEAGASDVAAWTYTNGVAPLLANDSDGGPVAGGLVCRDSTAHIPATDIPPLPYVSSTTPETTNGYLVYKVLTGTGTGTATSTWTATATSTSTTAGLIVGVQAVVGTTAGTLAAGDDGRFTLAVQPGYDGPRTVYYALYNALTFWYLQPGLYSSGTHAQSVTSTPTAVATMTGGNVPSLATWTAGSYRLRIWASMASAPASMYYEIKRGTTLVATSATVTIATGSAAMYDIVTTIPNDASGSSSDYLQIVLWASSASTNNITISYGGSTPTYFSVPWAGFSTSTPLVASGVGTPGNSLVPAMSNHVHPAQTHASDDLYASTAIGASGGDYAFAYRTGTDTSTDTSTGTGTSCPLDHNCTMVRTSTTTATATVTNSVNGHAISINPYLNYADVGAPPTSRTVCGHALTSDVACTYSDVGADAAGAGTTAAQTAVNGSAGYVPYFYDAHTLHSLAPYSTTPAANSMPISDASGTLNSWVSHTTGAMAQGPASSTDLYTSHGWTTVASLSATSVTAHASGDATFYCTFATSASPIRVYARLTIGGTTIGPENEIDVANADSLNRRVIALSRVGGVSGTQTIALQMLADEPAGSGSSCTVEPGKATLAASNF